MQSGKKRVKTVIEEMKQTMLPKSVEVRRYQQRIEKFRKNRIFDFEKKKIYGKFNRGGMRTNNLPNAEKRKTKSGDIWSTLKGQDREVEWLKNLKN